MAMSCTEPEEVSKGSMADLATLSKRIPPSSSSLTATRAHQTHSAQRHGHFCCLLKGKFSKHTFWINDVLSALEVQAWEIFTPGKNIPLDHRKHYVFKGLSVPSPKKVPILANKMEKRRRTKWYEMTGKLKQMFSQVSHGTTHTHRWPCAKASVATPDQTPECSSFSALCCKSKGILKIS